MEKRHALHSGTAPKLMKAFTDYIRASSLLEPTPSRLTLTIPTRKIKIVHQQPDSQTVTGSVSLYNPEYYQSQFTQATKIVPVLTACGSWSLLKDHIYRLTFINT